MRRAQQSFIDGPYLQLGTFAVFTIGGCIYIAVTKSFNATPFWSMAVPVVLMLVFLGLSLVLGKLRMHDEQTGDNLYYMGFLYTLTSLGASLYNFGTGTSTDEVVRNFGVAITSTIAGIALRILYNQTRRDPADIEKAARHELAEMSRKVRTEMDSVSREFADFRRISNQMLEEGFHEIAAQAAKNGEHIRDILDKQASEAIKPVLQTSERLGSAMNQNYERIERQFAEIAQKVEAAGELLDKANTSMSESTARLGNQAGNVADKLEKVIVPDEVLKNDLAPMVKKLGELVGMYAVKTEHAAKDQNERMLAIAAMVEKVAASSERAAKAAETAAEVSSDQEDRFAKLAEAVEKQGIHISRVAKVVARKAAKEEIVDISVPENDTAQMQAEPVTVAVPKTVPNVVGGTVEIDGPEGTDEFQPVIQPAERPQRFTGFWNR